MPAPQAQETRLPRAVVRMSKEVQNLVDARNAQRESERNPELTPPTPPQGSEGNTPPAPEAAAPPSDSRDSDPGYWKQRFKVTEGLMVDLKTKRDSENAAARATIAELQSQLATLKTSTPSAPADIDLSAYFTPEQIDKFGDEQCRTMALAAQVAARGEAQALIKARVEPIEEARKADTAREATAAADRFRSKLDELHPAWRETDKAQPWLDWLEQRDEASGIKRQTILDVHAQALNAEMVARMFQQYEASIRPPAPPTAPHGNAASASVSAPPAAPAQAWTPARIKDFYKRAALGKVTDEERASVEAWVKAQQAH